MARSVIIVFALLVVYTSAQMPVPGFFNIPGTAFKRGGRVNFAGLSLGQVCKQIMMMGGKEALSDGMGAAAKWYANQKIPTNVAGGADPQMQCLYSQATGSMMPGMTGAKDPGNMFGDYFDTVIEYPMILDPCSSPQCNGKVNPAHLLIQMYAPMMRRGMGMGMGGGMPGMGGGLPGMGGAMGRGMPNPFGAAAQSPLLNALMPQQNSLTAPATAAANPTAATVPATTNAITPTAAPAPTPSVPQVPTPNNISPAANPMAALFQNPQMMSMFQHFLTQAMGNMGNMGQMPGTMPGAMGPMGAGAMTPSAMPAANPLAGLMGGGFPGLSSMFL